MRKNTSTPLTLRQGDVMLVRRGTLPARVTPVARDRGRVVLAYGEVTGHAHAMVEPGLELVEAEGVRYLRVDAVSQLLHEEHSTLVVEPGVYEVRIQREYSPEEIRNVQD